MSRIGQARLLLLLGLGLVAVLSSGCGPTIVYDYVPPASPEGRVCIAQCTQGRSLCEQNERGMYQACQSSYQLQMQNYNACKSAGGKGCLVPSWCATPNTAACQRNYRDCYAACGGQVLSRVVEHR